MLLIMVRSSEGKIDLLRAPHADVLGTMGIDSS